MSATTRSTHGVMEGGGSYNLHARIPAGGGNLALPYLEEAARSVTLGPGSDSIVIADYGSSQGKNSLAPMRAVIRCLRARVGSERPITVVHVDQHANDFNTLFQVLHSDDRFTRAFFQENRLTSGGAPMPPSGSAAFRR